jgi:hypothetical protein
MASKLLITDRSGQPIAGEIIYYDVHGAVIGREPISVQGTVLNATLIDQSGTVDIVSDGYYEFSTGSSAFEDDDTVSISLDKVGVQTKQLAKMGIVALLIWVLFKQ